MKKLLTSLFLLIAAAAIAQQDPLFSQYMFNKLAFNPAYAGSREVLTADILYRNQWVNIEGAPKTLSASIHSPMRNPHVALGLTMYNDNLGPTVFNGALATFAYRILFPNSRLSFGLQAGFQHMDIDWNAINVSDANDILFTNQVKKRAVPDANFGVYYYSNRYYIGLSSKHLLQNDILVYNGTDTGKGQFTRLATHFYGMAGIAIPLTENIVFRPSLLAKFVKNAPPQIDLNASFLFAKTLWMGVSYRSEKALSLLTEFSITQNIRLGYSYDIWFNELRAYNKGSHEIRLGFDFDVFENRMRTPRYF